jgi:hypothetical protein
MKNKKPGVVKKSIANIQKVNTVILYLKLILMVTKYVFSYVL